MSNERLDEEAPGIDSQILNKNRGVAREVTAHLTSIMQESELRVVREDQNMVKLMNEDSQREAAARSEEMPSSMAA